MNSSNSLWPQNTYFFSLNRAEAEYNYWNQYKNIPDAHGYGNNGDKRWWQDGATWQFIDSPTHSQQNDAIYHMMLGADNDQIVNVRRAYAGRHPKYNLYDYTGSPGSGKVHFTTTWYQMGIFSGQYSWQSAVTKNATVGGWLTIPYWPREYWRDLTSGNYVYKNANIKMGEGLILVDDVERKGNLKISFDYNIGNMINSTDFTSSQDLYFDLKKTNFLETSTDSDYFDGWEGSEERITIPMTKFKQHKYSKRDGKVSLIIPIDKEESLYIRLRPSNDNGYYAQIKNLKIVLESD